MFQVSVIDDANKILKYLSEHCNTDWYGVYRDTLSADELDANVANVRKALGDSKEPHGAYHGSTSALRNVTGVGSQQAIQLLKQKGRIIQAGKGRGKAVCLLNDSPLLEDEDAKTQQTDSVAADDIPALLSALTLAVYNQDKKIKDLSHQVALGVMENTALQSQLTKLQQNTITTWS